ncbi:MAG: hypothetical protein OJF59_002035 [Cytophagales bacterium]|nr:MAG: hypothetical protein OJF59_002035 [Cytophagales bacterium]
MFQQTYSDRVILKSILFYRIKIVLKLQKLGEHKMLTLQFPAEGMVG